MLPLVVAAPSLLSPAAVAASASLAVGVAAQLMRGPYPFRGSPPGTGAKGRNLQLLDALIRDAVAGARLPVAFPEPPKLTPGPLGPAGLAAAAAAVGSALLNGGTVAGDALGQIWGYVNSRPKRAGGGSASGDELLYLSTSGVDQPLSVSYTYSSQWARSYGTSAVGGNTGGPVTAQLGTGTSVRIIGKGSGRIEVNPADPGPKYISGVEAEVRKADGTKATFGILGTAELRYSVGVYEWTEREFSVGGVFAGGVPAVLANGVPSGFVVPQIEPETEPRRPLAPPLAPPAPPLAPPSPRPADPAVVPGAPVPGTPAPQPLGTPSPAPAIPRPVRPGEWQPGGPGTPSQPVPPGFPAPVIAPGRTPSPLPVRPPAVPDAQPTTPGGQVVPRPQPRPPVTRPGSEVINGIAIPNRPPAPTLQGIAAEVGRIEQKLAYQLRNPEDGTQDLATKLQELLDALENQQDAGVYELGGPCERDAEGQPIPFDDTKAQFDWGGKTSALANIASRIDALAELLQYHKLLKQPSCKNPQPTGEWVSINFRQTDFEAP